MISDVLIPYTIRHRYEKASHADGITLTNIIISYGSHHRSASSKSCKIHSRPYSCYACQGQRNGRINMERRLKSLKYFAPLVQIALCPITILFLWTVFTGPEVIPDVKEELVRKE